MADLLFDRVCRVIIARPLASDFASVSTEFVEVTGLRVEFKVTKKLVKDPNTCEITIYNLAETTRAAMQERGSKVILFAGYPGSTEQLFIGDARIIDHRREGPDWKTKIEAGDGERAYAAGRASASFAGGVEVPDIVKKVAGGMGLQVSGDLRGLAGKQLVSGYVAHGSASKELDKLLKSYGHEWSIQDGQVIVHRPGLPASNSVVVLSSDTGLVGAPEYGTGEKKGDPPTLKAKALLSPGLKPGGRVQFESLKHRGLHLIKEVKHDGDTHGGSWYTEIECEVPKA